MMLRDKVAVIYGAGGAIGGAAALAFAREGARVFVTGRNLAPVEAVAKDIAAGGGSAEAAQVDALDERAVDRHLESVIDTAAASISRSMRSGARIRTFWVCLWSSWMWSGSPSRLRPTPGRTS
jgi:NAD(P)-dependent dehydrogenase (short-subunit alcohol dehydrogenase family)